MSRACKYTEEHLAYLRAFHQFPLNVVTAAFNAHFGLDRTVASIKSAFKNHKIKRVRTIMGSTPTPSVYTPERVEWLREHYPLMQIGELSEKFNALFGLSVNKVNLHSALTRLGIKSGRTGHFDKGQVSWNKGVKGYMGANKTSFKPGNLPHNHKPLWSERIDSKDGYTYISVPETNPHTGFHTRYRQKHVWLWEQANGPTPKGCCIIFLDGDKLNFAPENLVCIQRNVLLVLNLHNYATAPADLKPSIMALAKLEAEAGVRTVRAATAGRRKKGSCHAS